MTTDVVVAGSGIAGMCAATAAVDNGAKVVVFEKANTTVVQPLSTAASWHFRAARSSSMSTV